MKLKKRPLKHMKRTAKGKTMLGVATGKQVIPKFGTAVSKSKRSVLITPVDVKLPRADKLQLRARD